MDRALRGNRLTKQRRMAEQRRMGRAAGPREETRFFYGRKKKGVKA